MTEMTSVGDDMNVVAPMVPITEIEVPFPANAKIYNSIVAWDESESEDEVFHYWNPS